MKRSPTKNLLAALTLFLALTSLMVVNTLDARADITLTDHNSIVRIDPGSPTGIYEWSISGTDHLYQQWYWYRIGETGREYSIDTISPAVSMQYGTNIAALSYSNNIIKVDMLYSLMGGPVGTGGSDLGSQIRITNLSGTAQQLHFFKYADFDINGSSALDTATFANPNLITQAEAGTLVQSTAVPQASRWQIGAYPDILNSLGDGNPTSLINAVASYTGDATWALQWDVKLAANESTILSFDQHVSAVPVPAAVWLLGSGLVGLAGLRSRFLGA